MQIKAVETSKFTFLLSGRFCRSEGEEFNYLKSTNKTSKKLDPSPSEAPVQTFIANTL
jgi:hypothetical protein